MLPKDPFMLLSVVNTKLRDEFTNLDDLCASFDIERQELEKQLSDVGFQYQADINQFK